MRECVSNRQQHDACNAHKAQVLSRSHALQDVDCVSIRFFKMLQTNQSRTLLAKIEMDDGSIFFDGDAIAFCGILCKNSQYTYPKVGDKKYNN